MALLLVLPQNLCTSIVFFCVGEPGLNPCRRVRVRVYTGTGCAGYNNWYPDPYPSIPGAKTRPGFHTRGNHYKWCTAIARVRPNAPGLSEPSVDVALIVLSVACFASEWPLLLVFMSDNPYQKYT